MEARTRHFGDEADSDAYIMPSDSLLSTERGFFLSRRKATILGALVFVLAVVCFASVIAAFVVGLAPDNSDSSSGDNKNVVQPKNLIFMLSDGCGPATYTLGRTMANRSLALDAVLVGASRTRSSSSLITDSAAGATAYACGHKSYNGAIAVDPVNRKALGTLLEAAKAKGMKTGIVTTSRITHASPASFASHAVDRDMEQFIATQEVYSNIDVMFGGGKTMFTSRSDNVDLFQVARDKGYSVITTAAELLSLPSSTTKVLGIFADSHLDYEIDRTPQSTQPTLLDMATSALSILSKNNDKGFFLFIEGARIDMAGHDNDAAAHYQELLMYDSTAKMVLEHTKADQHSFMVGTSDHETGGFSIGVNQGGGVYPEYAWWPERLAAVTASAYTMSKLIAAGGNITQVLQDKAAITLTAEQLTIIQNAVTQYQGKTLLTTIGEVVARYAGLGWSTWAHTAVDVNVYAQAQSESLIAPLRGNQENIDISRYLQQLFKLDVDAITESLKDFDPTNGGQGKRSAAMPLVGHHD